jgi:hypothetical protein
MMSLEITADHLLRHVGSVVETSVALLSAMACAAGGGDAAPHANASSTGGRGVDASLGGGGASVSGGTAGRGSGGGGGAAGVGGNLATPMDAGAAELASRCETPGGALCDGFEDSMLGGAPDTAKWNVITSYSGMPSSQNTITIDTAQRARGAQALHVHTETSDPVYIETKRLPSLGNAFYGRVFAYFDQDPGARTRGHWGAFVGVGKRPTVSQDVEVRLGGQFDILVVNYSPNDALQISSSRDGFYDDGARLPIRTWTCFEFLFDGGHDEMRVWMDGVEIERLHVTDWGQFGHSPTPGWSPTYDRLRIGYQSWNADTPIDVWYDAVVVDTERVGCAR